MKHITYKSSSLTKDPFVELREAAANGTPAEFIEAVANIDDWRQSSHILEAIELALNRGCYATAVKLAGQGIKLYPEDDRLRKYAHVLSPPEVVKTDIPPNKGLGASMKWLKAYGAEYRGQWVVIQNGELLAHANVRSDLTEILKNLPAEAGIVVTKIPGFEIRF